MHPRRAQAQLTQTARGRRLLHIEPSTREHTPIERPPVPRGRREREAMHVAARDDVCCEEGATADEERMGGGGEVIPLGPWALDTQRSPQQPPSKNRIILRTE